MEPAETVTSAGILIREVFGTPDRQADLGALLAFVPAGGVLPGSGGVVAEPGSATPGYRSARPLPIWCAVPVLRGRDDPTGMVRCAIRNALDLVAREEFGKIGLVCGMRDFPPLSTMTLNRIAVRELMAAAGLPSLREIRFVAADSAIRHAVRGWMTDSPPPPRS